jgi:hypothetical protein
LRASGGAGGAYKAILIAAISSSSMKPGCEPACKTDPC